MTDRSVDDPALEVVWTQRALGDLTRIRSYIAAQAPIAAARLSSRLVAAGDSLDRHPERGRVVTGGVRELLVVKPYAIRYRVGSRTIRILHIRHMARRRD